MHKEHPSDIYYCFASQLFISFFIFYFIQKTNHMNWKLILQLSVFGLIMACATVTLIPTNVEPIFWLLIFLFCGYVIARVCNGKYFLHGFLVCLANCVWIVAVHIFFYNTYILHHPEEAKMVMPPPLSIHPRLTMLIIGAMIGIISGLVLGLIAFIFSKFVKKSTIAA